MTLTALELIILFQYRQLAVEVALMDAVYVMILLTSLGALLLLVEGCRKLQV